MNSHETQLPPLRRVSFSLSPVSVLCAVAMGGGGSWDALHLAPGSEVIPHFRIHFGWISFMRESHFSVETRVFLTGLSPGSVT